MKRANWLWPAIILISSISIGLVALANIDSPLRPALAFWFLLICPGMAWIRVLHVGDILTELTLAIALSLALGAVVAMAMLYSGLWSPPRGLVALICISAAGSAAQIWLGARQRPQAEQEPGWQENQEE